MLIWARGWGWFAGGSANRLLARGSTSNINWLFARVSTSNIDRLLTSRFTSNINWFDWNSRNKLKNKIHEHWVIKEFSAEHPTWDRDDLKVVFDLGNVYQQTCKLFSWCTASLWKALFGTDFVIRSERRSLCRLPTGMFNVIHSVNKCSKLINFWVCTCVYFYLNSTQIPPSIESFSQYCNK